MPAHVVRAVPTGPHEPLRVTNIWENWVNIWEVILLLDLWIRLIVEEGVSMRRTLKKNRYKFKRSGFFSPISLKTEDAWEQGQVWCWWDSGRLFSPRCSSAYQPFLPSTGPTPKNLLLWMVNEDMCGPHSVSRPGY